MNKKLFLFIGILSLLFFPVHFSFAEEPSGPADTSEALEASVGEDVVISMESNQTTGYQWKLKEPPDTGILKLASSKYAPDSGAAAGAGGNEIWIFKAVGAGKAVLNFEYVRPWEKDAAPAKVKTVIITVQ
jgi:inhibitor of cysteine peptidase